MTAQSLHSRFEPVLGKWQDWQFNRPPETVESGIPEIDRDAGGLPRGRLTEIFGPASSGRTTLLVSILAKATARGESCALVDAEDVFDPISAAAAGVKLHSLLWVRCNHNAEHALKAADLLIQGGGFGVVVMNLGDTSADIARRIPLTSWFRLCRAVERTPTVLVTLAQRSNAKTCVSLQLECTPERVEWSGARNISRLLRGLHVRVNAARKNKTCSLVFTAPAI